jgi:protoheme IX farnesyltransferase
MPGIVIREYFQLTKPGIIYGNALSAAAGYFIGAGSGMSVADFLLMIFGVCLIVGSGCVLNNYIDRDIDAKMERTRNRALVRGAIPLHDAASFGILLGICGITLLYIVSPLALFVALFGLFVYVVVYSVWSKRYTLHATIIGAVAGAVPPVVGYVSATNALDVGALLIFLILFSWQIPHALAIAIRRAEDYRRAGIPVMPLTLGLFATKIQMLSYAVLFFIAAVTLSFKGYTGATFMWLMGGLGGLWILLCLRGFLAEDGPQWAKQVFLFSLIIICAFCLLGAFNSMLP